MICENCRLIKFHSITWQWRTLHIPQSRYNNHYICQINKRFCMFVKYSPPLLWLCKLQDRNYIVVAKSIFYHHHLIIIIRHLSTLDLLAICSEDIFTRLLVKLLWIISDFIAMKLGMKCKLPHHFFHISDLLIHFLNPFHLKSWW